MSITIEKELVDDLKRLSRQSRRSLSNIMELAVVEYLKNRGSGTAIPTSSGSFQGSFSRRKTYENR